jgi:transposase-like protein
MTAIALEPVHCPTCNSTNIVKHGKTAERKQRYKCRNPECTRYRFVLEYSYRGYLPAVKQQICEMALNGSGIKPSACASRSEIPHEC